MKRRLPTIRQGEVVLAAISLPPHTDDTNLHKPRPAHPGSAAAAPNAAVTATSANRPGSAAGGPAPRPARPPAPRTPRRVPGRGSRTAAPSPARSYAGHQPAPRPGATRTARRPRPRSPRRPPRPCPAARPARTPGAGHDSPGTARSAPAARRSSGTAPPRGHAASNPTTTPSARRTKGNPGAGTPPVREWRTGTLSGLLGMLLLVLYLLPHRRRPERAGCAVEGVGCRMLIVELPSWPRTRSHSLLLSKATPRSAPWNTCSVATLAAWRLASRDGMQRTTSQARTGRSAGTMPSPPRTSSLDIWPRPRTRASPLTLAQPLHFS